MIFLNNFKKSAKEFKMLWDRMRYKGNGVECTICHATYRVFGSFGTPHRKNAHCLNCGSLERHRLLFLYFHKHTSLFSQTKKKLLHFAPEKMFYNVFSKDAAIDYYPCDLFPEIYDFNGPVKILKVDITSIPFESDQFDVVICNHVLEHIPDDNLAMTEIKRVLKPDGWCILQVPLDYDRSETYEDFSITDPLERKKAFGRAGHVRWYGRDYGKRLESAGFKVREDSFTANFSDEDLFRFGLNPKELIYYCVK